MDLKYTKLNVLVNNQLSRDFSGKFNEYVRAGDEGWLVPIEFLKYASYYRNFISKPEDIWICSYPKSGAGLIHNISWILQHNFDYKKFEDYKLQNNPQFFEYQIFNEYKFDENHFENILGRRVIKTHLPFELLPLNLFTSGAKIIYLTQNVKQQIISCYDSQKIFCPDPFIGSFDKYWNYLEEDLLLFTPYWKHLEQAWIHRNDSNFLFLFFEDMKSELRTAMIKLARFLDKSLTTQQIIDIENVLNIDKYGHTKPPDDGDICKQYFSDELNGKADKWIESNVKKIADLKYCSNNNLY